VPTHQAILTSLSGFLLMVAAAGVVARGRVRLCASFFAYVLVALAGNQLTVWWPNVFYTPTAWQTKNAAYTCLTALVVIEIALLTFVRTPRARGRAVAGMLAVALTGVAVAIGAPAGASNSYLAALSKSGPRVDAAMVWLMLVVVAVAEWHRLPIHPYHRAIVLGRGGYLGFDVLVFGLLGPATGTDHGAYQALAALSPLAYMASASLWAWAAWRPIEQRGGIFAYFQPWAAPSGREAWTR